jgi:type VI secretion system protein
MPIEITITKSPKNVSNTKACQVFNEQGGTIGRGGDNAWILEDPNRYISTRHVAISCEGGQYYLTDISTNGTFYNGGANPVGNGNRVPLKEGDRFSLSDYEFHVSIRDGAAANGFADPFATAAFAGSAADLNFDASYNNAMPPAHDDPFANPFLDNAPLADTPYTLAHEETDPLAALDKAHHRFSSQDYLPPSNVFAPTQSDHADAMNQSVIWPSAIPEDWDEEGANASANAQNHKPAKPRPTKPATPPGSAELLLKLDRAEQRNHALEAENTRLLSDIAVLRQQLRKAQEKPAAHARADRAVTSQDKALIEALGLAKWNLNDQQTLEISQVVGELVLETMAGLMQVLTFRKKIKEEFRINVTTIRPVENNPLKFSANLEDAMENMFIKNNKAYQKPVEAVREGFQGIAEHQVAVLAGVQAAFRGMIERFDPEALERRFEKYRKAGVIKVGQKGKNWDAYKEFHQDLINNMDNSFQHLFGYDFVQAYENQLQKLAISRKASGSGNSGNNN